MYTATITKKDVVPQGVQLEVTFSNGTDTLVETIVPQDKRGFNHWVDSRIKSLDTLDEMKAEDNVNKVVDTSTPVETETQAVIDEREWFKNYTTLQEVQKLIDLAVLTGTEPKVVALRAKVKADFKPAYLNLI